MPNMYAFGIQFHFGEKKYIDDYEKKDFLKNDACELFFRENYRCGNDG